MSEEIKEKSQKSQKTEELDGIVFETIKETPGITAKKLELALIDNPKGPFRTSFLTNSLRRLIDERRIYSTAKKEFEHGKIVREYYVTEGDYDLKLGYDILQKNVGYSDNKQLCAFAINNKIIGIATNDNEFYKKTYPFFAPFKTVKSDDILKLKFPEKFVEFYNLKPEEYSFNYLPPNENNGIELEVIHNVESQPDYQPKQKLNVLIFEDDVDYCNKLADRVRLAGHNVSCAYHLEEFKDYLEKEKFDFISLDKRIVSELDEVNAANLFFDILKKSPETQIGLLTRKLEDFERKYYQNLGFNAILVKKENKIGDQLVKVLRTI